MNLETLISKANALLNPEEQEIFIGEIKQHFKKNPIESTIKPMDTERKDDGKTVIVTFRVNTESSIGDYWASQMPSLIKESQFSSRLLPVYQYHVSV